MMKKIIMSEYSARQLKLKDGDMLMANGVERMVITFNYDDPYKNFLLTDEEVEVIVRNNTVELVINSQHLTNG